MRLNEDWAVMAQDHRLIHVELALQPFGKREDIPAEDRRHEVGIQGLTQLPIYPPLATEPPTQ